MQTLAAIHARRAIKHFDPHHSLPAEDLRALLDAAVQTPSAFNMQNWRLVRVTDPARRAAIRAAGNDQAQITEASELFVITADLAAWRKEPMRYWRDAPPEVASVLVNWMGPFYAGKAQLQRDEAMRSCGLIAQTLMLAAKALGYDSCPMTGFEADRVAELIRLPSDHVIGMLLAVGKAVQPAWPKPGQLPLEELVIEDAFGAHAVEHSAALAV